MTIALVDTSVFCEIVPVPGRSQRRDATLDEFEALIREGVTLLLPIATILETGNHIAHIADGHLRRRTAERCVNLVKPALGNVAGPAPWTVPDPLLDPEDLQHYLDEFPDCATFRSSKSLTASASSIRRIGSSSGRWMRTSPHTIGIQGCSSENPKATNDA